MSDTTTCPSCSATLPPNATFCTSCGTRIGEAASAPASSTPPPPPPDDATRVDNPGLHDATQVYSPPPPAPPAAGPTGPAPWQPADTSAAAPGPAAWSPPGQAPPAAPPAAPPWQQQPPAPAGWGAPGAPPAPQWGASAPAATSATGDGSPIGGLLAIVGGVLSLIGLFTAWIGADGSNQTLSGWDLVSGDEFLTSKDPYLILALALGALVLGVLLFTGVSRKVVRIAAIVVGLALVVTPIRDWLSVVDIVEGLPGAKANQEFGFFLTIAGGVLVAAAAFLPTKAKTA